MRWLASFLVLLLLAACTHDTSDLRAVPMDAGADTTPCADLTFESASPGPGSPGIFMDDTTLHVWRFRVDGDFRASELGMTVEAPTGGSFQGAIFSLTAADDDPDGTGFGTTDVVASGTVTVGPALAPRDITIALTSPNLTSGWYAVGVRLTSGDARVAGNSPTGEAPYRLLGSGSTSTTGARRLFVRGCRDMP